MCCTRLLIGVQCAATLMAVSYFTLLYMHSSNAEVILRFCSTYSGCMLRMTRLLAADFCCQCRSLTPSRTLLRLIVCSHASCPQLSRFMLSQGLSSQQNACDRAVRASAVLEDSATCFQCTMSSCRRRCFLARAQTRQCCATLGWPGAWCPLVFAVPFMKFPSCSSIHIHVVCSKAGLISGAPPCCWRL